MKKRRPYTRCYQSDVTRDVYFQDMNAAERGVFTSLMFAQMERGVLPRDEVELVRITMLTSSEFQKGWTPRVIAMFEEVAVKGSTHWSCPMFAKWCRESQESWTKRSRGGQVKAENERVRRTLADALRIEYRPELVITDLAVRALSVLDANVIHGLQCKLADCGATETQLAALGFPPSGQNTGEESFAEEEELPLNDEEEPCPQKALPYPNRGSCKKSGNSGKNSRRFAPSLQAAARKAAPQNERLRPPPRVVLSG